MDPARKKVSSAMVYTKRYVPRTPKPTGPATVKVFRKDELDSKEHVIDPFSGSEGHIIQRLLPRLEYDPSRQSWKVKKINIRGNDYYCEAILVRVTKPAPNSHHREGDMVPWQIPVRYVPAFEISREMEFMRGIRSSRESGGPRLTQHLATSDYRGGRRHRAVEMQEKVDKIKKGF